MNGPSTGFWNRFISELRRRRLHRAAGVYAAVAFVVWQVADIAVPALYLPDWTITLVVVLAILGFPLALTLAWVFDMTPSGLQRTESLLVAPTSKAPAAESVVPHNKSIVVTPFENVGGEPENEYFCDGLTEELIIDLSQLSALRVISRTSAMKLRNSGRSARSIGEELGVRYVLTGSVRKAGTSLRITAQLIDSTSETQVWADRYTVALDDVLDVQDRVSREIAGALDIKLSTAETQAIAGRAIDDASAYDCYLRARYEIAQASPGGVSRARTLLRRGLEISPRNPRLRGTMVFLDVFQMRTEGRLNDAGLEAGATNAEEILQDDPREASAHYVLGLIALERGRLPEAAARLKSALTFDPSDVDAAIWLGVVYIWAGQIDVARGLMERLQVQDPLSPFPSGLASVVEWFDGDFEAGIEPMVRCMELAPESTIWRWHWGYLLALLGRYSDASDEAMRMQQSDEANPYTRQLVAMTAALRGEISTAQSTTTALDVGRADPHMMFHIGECWALIGEEERAVEIISRAVAGGFCPYAFIARHNPFLKSLRTNPAFQPVIDEARRRWQDFRAAEQVASDPLIVSKTANSTAAF
jgi:eukaryotic-like serine/threonine-protein kinase